ncbi:MAG TPA: hypothetical protein VF904_00515 [Anaeromyxobacteraceae bacterium]
MGRRQTAERSTPAAELSALLAAGDHRAARTLAREILAGAAEREADREAARAALARVAPERGASVAAAAGLLFLAVVAALGLLLRA